MSGASRSRRLVSVGFIVVVIVSVAILLDAPRSSSTYASHPPISIQTNAQFTPSRGVVGGSGLPFDPYVIEGWEIDASTGHGIWITQTTAWYIIRHIHVHSGGPDWYGVLLDYAPNGRIENSTILGNKLGVAVVNSDNVAVVDNTIDANDQYGISSGGISWSNNTVVSRNSLTGNGVGILAGTTAYSLISDNVIAGSYYGIWLLMSPTSITVSGNRVSGANEAGIYLEYASDVEVVGNYVTGTRLWGLMFAGGPGIQGHHNTLVGNGVNAYPATGVIAEYDNGFPSGGNYWDDYAGVDNCGGPNQDVCTGPDGLGDTPYVVDINHRDRYPLMASPPDAFPPTAANLTAAVLVGPSVANLRITWARAADEGTAGGTVAYQVLRSSTWFGGYSVLVTAPATGQPTYQYLCNGCGHSVADTSTKFYRIRTVDAAGNTADSDAAAKTALPVAPGGRLVSVPLLQENWSFTAVFQTISFDRVRTFRSADGADPWKAWYGARTGDLTAAQSGEAYWVDVTLAGVLTVAGLVETTPSVALRPGWNLVSYSAWGTETRAQSLAGVPGVVDVETFNPAAGPYGLRTVAPAELLLAGEGYWVRLNGSLSTWVQG